MVSFQKSSRDDSTNSVSSNTDVDLTDTSHELSRSSHSENSVYEVVDVATQTERLSPSHIDLCEDQSTQSMPCDENDNDHDTTEDTRNSLTDYDSKNSKSITDVSGSNNNMKYGDDNEHSASREIESSCNSPKSRVHAHPREETCDSASNLESSYDNISGNSKARSIQKANYCFDLSSDSDSTTSFGDVVENCENNNTGNGDDLSDIQSDNWNYEIVTQNGDKISNNRNNDRSKTVLDNGDKATDAGNRAKPNKADERGSESWR